METKVIKEDTWICLEILLVFKKLDCININSKILSLKIPGPEFSFHDTGVHNFKV